MRTPAAAVALIKQYEGLRLKAYRCSAGKLTIGYGSTREVLLGMTITIAQAEHRLQNDLADAEAAVDRLTRGVQLTPFEFGALVSFVFNLGERKVGKSTLLHKLKAGDRRGAANEFPKWVNVRDPDTGAIRPEAGLVRRRRDERALFLTPATGAA